MIYWQLQLSRDFACQQEFTFSVASSKVWTQTELSVLGSAKRKRKRLSSVRQTKPENTKIRKHASWWFISYEKKRTGNTAVVERRKCVTEKREVWMTKKIQGLLGVGSLIWLYWSGTWHWLRRKTLSEWCNKLLRSPEASQQFIHRSFY